MSRLTSFPLLTSSLLLTSLIPLTASCPGTGATEDIGDVIIGRCVEYKTLVNPSAVCGQSTDLNCSRIAEIFLEAFAGQPTCNVTQSRYDAFLSATRHELPVDMSIFWHSVYTFVHQYSQRGARKMTLEDSLTGYLIDGLRFCASPSEDGGIGGPNTQFCPTSYQTQNCTWNAEASFWSTASRNFATRARGRITVMLNGSTGEAFSETSYFGVWELPNLASGVVTGADIWLMHTPGDVVRETCNSASIQNLKKHLSAKSISSTCTENPRDALWLLCWDRQEHPECQALVTSGTEAMFALEKIVMVFVVAFVVCCRDLFSVCM